jgi:hypothetical protein
MGAGFQNTDEERIKLETSEGDELNPQPEEDGDRFKVISPPDDVEGHVLKVMPFVLAPKRKPKR